MDTSLALQDQGLISLSAAAPATSCNTDLTGLFASTLQQELNYPGVELPVASGIGAAPELPPRSPRQDPDNSRRLLLTSSACAASLPAPATGATDDSTVTVAAPSAAILPGSERCKPMLDAAEPDAEYAADRDSKIVEPRAETMIPVEPINLTIAPASFQAPLPPPVAYSTAGLLPGQFKVARSVTVVEPPRSTTVQPYTAAADAALPTTPELIPVAQERKWTGQHSPGQDRSTGSAPASSTSTSNSPTTEFQQPQAISPDSMLRFITAQPVVAPELDQGMAAQAAPVITSLNPADAPSPAPGSARTSAEPRPYSLLSEIPAGSEGWGEDIGNQITWLSEQEIRKAELTLHPAELGALDITINSDSDRVTVTIVTRNDAARELLQDNLPRLAELLRNNGLALEHSTVSQHSAGERRAQSNSKPGDSVSQDSNSSAGTERPRATLLHAGQIDHYV